jgi:hypothetical protein
MYVLTCRGIYAHVFILSGVLEIYDEDFVTGDLQMLLGRQAAVNANKYLALEAEAKSQKDSATKQCEATIREVDTNMRQARALYISGQDEYVAGLARAADHPTQKKRG